MKPFHLLVTLVVLCYPLVLGSAYEPLQTSSLTSSQTAYLQQPHKVATEDKDIHEEKSINDLIRRRRNVAEVASLKSLDGGDDDDYSSSVPDDVTKRRWDKNSMNVWGKRSGDEFSDVNKRQWGTRSMNVWGKRTALLGYDQPQAIDEDSQNEDTYPYVLLGDDALTRRKPLMNPEEDREEKGVVRGKKSYWIKQMPVKLTRPRDEMKRRWKENTMNVWG
ncbi:hypothetical protein HELRODRAFT_192887 [Helobdella robusta]|uniref:Uncharacterized protein n=1 Tax=Helobdella robusta TaxID=6412 RepID=T1FUE0_HELRO|nr:hypothetical protein HELRODRAFT_192887 [Helobdella robusta]ESN99641.1 hypothetical protein HELRODRAFT_192887 [Helobdella robusta]